jgi:chromosome segregation ATPase
LLTDIERLEAQMEASERTRKSLEKRVEELDSELNGGEGSKTVILDAKKRLESEVEMLREQLHDAEQAKQELENARREGTSELEYLKSKVQTDADEKIEKLEEARRALLASQRYTKVVPSFFLIFIFCF